MTLDSAPARGTRRETLYVDLDGTLIASDLLWESCVQLLRRDPLAVLRLPLWLARGRAAFKREVCGRARPDVARLPYREEVLAYVRSQRALGRPCVLASASDEALVRQVAAHTGLFDDAFGSDGRSNEKGAAKLRSIRRREGDAAFEYVGDAAADLAIWREADRATLVSPSPSTARRAGRLGVPVHVLVPRASSVVAALRALRPHQWVKNGLLFVPLVLAHQLGDLERLWSTALATVAFCLIASASYLWNDLLDVEADRRHPRKRNRPFAAGALPLSRGVPLSFGLLGAGFALAAFGAPSGASAMLGLYLLLTLLYSCFLKEQLLIDVLLLAGLYSLRVVTGAVTAQLPVSPWLLAFSLFFFLSLAFVKRAAELIDASRAREPRGLERRGYEVGDLALVETTGVCAGYLAVLVLALYVNSSAVAGLYARPAVLWAVCPILLYWITRVWFLVRRGRMHDDPVVFATTDPVSWATGAAVAGVGLLAV